MENPQIYRGQISELYIYLEGWLPIKNEAKKCELYIL